MDIARIKNGCALTLLASCAISIGGVAFGADALPPAASTAAEQSTHSIGQQITAMQTEVNQKQQEAYQAYVAAAGKSNEERIKEYQEKLPHLDQYAKKGMELARDNPKDPAAIDALLFVLQMTPGNGPDDLRLGNEAIAQLSRDDLDNPKLSGAFSKFMYNPSEAGEKLMRLAAEKSSNRDVRGPAMFWLAQSLKTSAEQVGDPSRQAEAKKLYESVAADYADVNTARGALGDQARANLYEMENLSVGKAAPEIEGKGADGKPIKLSDYAGKVVVIDFWGNW